MEKIERIEIDSDSDTEKTTTIDKNHNIDKKVQCAMAMASTSCPTVPDSPGNRNSCLDVPVKMECETITISDSEEDSQEANVADNESENSADAKNDQSIEQNEIKHEQKKSDPESQQISKRVLRSSRRPNFKSYNEDELNASRDEPGASNDFPKGPTKPKFVVDASRIPKNNDQTMFYSNFLYKSMCLLCGCSDKNLAVHYARKHPETEVFIARLSPKMATRIRSRQDFWVSIDGQIHGFCFFCEELKIMKDEDWKKHLVWHTGEQMYHCTGCNESVVRKSNHGQCSKDTVRNIFESVSCNGDLIGSICNTCNYLQVSKERLQKHIQAEHDSYDGSYIELFSEVVLVKTPTV
ncbi:uncharacterized protein LOC129572637 [Sitodiplosis mosellana]|uniref:uncharacterized protein LOC129572637 n=1 Tax=Sitodiplosis mosellana TaxID=263140 RepID=UPI002443916F|nr:uncharacterized protein LOC129572637 [Sitodiplosis mosellana]